MDANSVQKMSIVEEPIATVTDVYYSSLHNNRFMSQANLISMQRFFLRMRLLSEPNETFQRSTRRAQGGETRGWERINQE